MKLDKEEKLNIYNALLTRYKDIEKDFLSSKHVDYKSMYFDLLMEFDSLIQKFEKELFYAKKNN